MGRCKLRTKWRGSGCVLPYELGVGNSTAGPVTVRKATTEELAALEKELGPLCPPQRAEMIRAKYKTLAGLRKKPKKKDN